MANLPVFGSDRPRRYRAQRACSAPAGPSQVTGTHAGQDTLGSGTRVTPQALRKPLIRIEAGDILDMGHAP